jgi:sigma-B regulation protein RsbU (phosphoserine phosphatase)
MSLQVGLQMAFLSGAVRSALSTADSPRAALRTLNAIVWTLQSSGCFVTLLLIVLDPRSHAATIVNAGHQPVLWRHADGSVEEPDGDQSGLPLGLLDDSDYAETTIELATDDLLVLYTDGVHDVLDGAGGVFGLRRLCSCLANAGRDAITVGKAILGEVSRFRGDAPVTDDMCLVCVRRLP